MKAIEQGAPAGTENRVAVTLRVADHMAPGRIPAVLAILERGLGLSVSFDLATSDSLDLTVSQQFATALAGTLSL